MTQNERVLQYLKDFGTITSLEALRDLGVMRLASRINELKDMGLPVQKRLIAGQNRYGETIRYAQYYLEGEQA